MPKNKNSPVRLNIYIHDPGMRRQIKAMAAQKDVSVSEFCVQAITNHLLKEKDFAGEEIRSPLKLAVKKAYQFQKKTFGVRVFAVSSADLIRESREDRRAL